ncbi:MAG: ribbon-helix-helix domain-containing protein [Chloroflexi bacterium]|jgi:predicted transcriptional regulator|nr:ribbon-helix-helix domain-containing protein [Chloroflexota bacterium]
MATATLTLPKETLEKLDSVAAQTGVTVSDLADKAIQQYLRREAERKIIREEEAYHAQHNQLLKQYHGQFIAMHEGQVVDHDMDELTLYLRIRQQYPQTGVLIKRVTSGPDEVWHMRSPRLEYD